MATTQETAVIGVCAAVGLLLCMCLAVKLRRRCARSGLAAEHGERMLPREDKGPVRPEVRREGEGLGVLPQLRPEDPGPVVLPEVNREDLSPIVLPEDRTPVSSDFGVIVFPLAKAANAGHLGGTNFPHSIGPFRLQATKGIHNEDLVVDRNALTWRLKERKGTSRALKETHKAAQKKGGQLGSYLSPLAAVNLSDRSKKDLGIPLEAASFAWSYPARNEAFRDANYDNDLDFLRTGGYVYFSKDYGVCGILALSPELTGAFRFGDSQDLDKDVARALIKAKRFKDVTLATFREQGATHFCWVCPDEELAGQRPCPYGGFAYLFEDGEP